MPLPHIFFLHHPALLILRVSREANETNHKENDDDRNH